MDKENLINRFKNKEISAFEKLHSMYAENILGVINTIIKNPERAQEVC